ncbi:secreted RxLR effector peptide protein, putative [Phytophthora infestans T30-4]|uniref:Secreted RxLR effector peptide protein, putative n=1 Tax=Phytophthora infestans (strain T30-4) TaxID=403677 RepID=D0P1B1_PHYIT|nr:secreted RxLR effector peptide protein, putative [Phytophthora infestans T30-4]EEY54137.1 secreted RxLR effector peptide protein, putative [Phytophthora infestans T30-4]|eukprot:XP_002895921.1 secreted RxLR effector peptide protein, putative [Phytophthora infestans T30-4]
MRSTFYVALAFAIVTRSSASAELPNPDETGLLSDTYTKRSLRVAGQEVARGGQGDEFVKVIVQSTVVHLQFGRADHINSARAYAHNVKQKTNANPVH